MWTVWVAAAIPFATANLKKVEIKGEIKQHQGYKTQLVATNQACQGGHAGIDALSLSYAS